MKREFLRTATLFLILAGLLAAPMTVWSKTGPATSSAVRMARPGSREAAVQPRRLRLTPRYGGAAYTQNTKGLWVPDRKIYIADKKGMRDQGKWLGIQRGVQRYLAKTGARPSPAPYQNLVNKIRRRGELVLNREGKSLASWKMIVLEGGKADQVNAAAWTGGVITIYRPLVDLCFQIANVVVNTKGPRKIDKELWHLSRWRRDKSKNSVPKSQKVSPDKKDKRDRVAESILSRVVLHEMGHAASGHVQLKDQKLFIPGKHEPKDYPKSRAMEREADQFALKLGTSGAVRIPGVMPLFSYYNFIDRPTFDKRGKNMIADWRTHPLNAERYNNQWEALAKVKRATGLPEPLEQRLVLPTGGFATPDPKVVPLRPKPAPPRVMEPLKKAADSMLR